MNILIINHYAGSLRHGMQYRQFYLAREWQRLGHKVSIAAASFSHVRSRNPNINGNVTMEEIDDIQYVWFRTPKYEGNGIGRVLNMLVFGLSLALSGPRIFGFRKPDLVIASSPHPFIFFGAGRIARAFSARLVFEVRDLWPLTLIELGGISPRHPFIIMMQKIENIAYRASDHVISLLPKAAGYMKEHGLRDGKFTYIPNGISVDEWNEWRDGAEAEGGSGHIRAVSQIKQEGKLIVGYAGAHGLANGLGALIEAAALLRAHPVSFVLVGHGPEKEALERAALQNGLQNVLFLDSVPRSAIPELLASMDILYIGLKNEPLFRFGISPNKLMDYMMAGKPIIHAINAGNDLVAEADCGISVAPEDPRAIKDAVIELVNMTAAERKDMGSRGKEYVLARHDYRVLAKRYLEAFETDNGSEGNREI